MSARRRPPRLRARGAPGRWALALGLLAAGLLLTGPAGAQKYRYPIADKHVSKTYVTAYFDHSGKDWNCGTKRYSGHRGNDYGCGSFSGMDAGRDIVAGADGKVIWAEDGHYDRCTTANCSGGSGYGNYVKLQHKDGKYSYYAHMKKGSVAVKTGASVTCGQKLGQVGSSGYSTGPHLHFEVRSGSSRRDPYKGSCGGYGYWVSQGSYLKTPSTKCDGPSTPQLAASFVGQGANALKGSGGAYYSLCPGQAFDFWFSLKNTGSLTWEDNGKSGTAGQAVALGRRSDPFGAPSRVSVKTASDPKVSPGQTTKFTIKGKAPGKAGSYKTEWRLVSEGVAWFGPTMYLTFAVTNSPPEAGGSCSTGLQGVCAAGTKGCQGGAIACLAPSPSSEKCDGKDNDCDGQTDETLSQSCYSGPAGTRGVGICRAGSQSCAAGKWGACQGEVRPKPSEACNGRDDDCDGQTDEGCTCQDGASQTCYKAACPGTQRCQGGSWGQCVAAPEPQERCGDRLDNDCDGQIDEPDCVAGGDGGPGGDPAGSGYSGQTLSGGCGGCATAGESAGGLPALLASLVLLVLGRRRPRHRTAAQESGRA